MNRFVLPVIFCSIIFITGCKQKTEEKEEASKYTVTSPLLMDTSFVREYVAQIQAVRNIEVRAQEKGYLEQIFVDEGQYVHAGQLLFRIMPKMYEAELLKAEAAVKEASLDLLNAKTLAEKNIVSKTEQQIAEAKLDEAKAEEKLARLHLSLTEIKAPYAGVIDRLPLKIGALVDEGALLTTLSDNSNVYAYYNVPESEYLGYKTLGKTDSKQQVSLLLANGQLHKHPGIIETIEGQFDNETGNIAFRAKFPNPDMLLKHGETGKVQMTVPLKNALIIPQKATYELQDKVYVFVVGKDNKISSRNIIIKSRISNIYIVESGLAAGDKILLDGVQTAKDDQQIEYTYADPKATLSSLQLIRQ